MTWDSQQQLLSQMDRWAPLPDQDDARWDDTGDVWDDAERLLEAARASGSRRWQQVAVRVFEHAADWDVHGMMLDLRHGPERAFDGPGGPRAFATRLEPLSEHPRAGTRLWVVHELGLLRRDSSLPFLVARTRDEHRDVAEAALLAVSRSRRD